MRIKGVLLGAMLLGACGSERGDGDGRTAADSAGGAVAAPAAADTTAAAASVPAGQPAASRVVLAADGVDVGAGRLAFGGGREQVLASVGAVLGAPQQQGTNEECPAGLLGFTWYVGGLQLVFQDSAFVGWFAQEGSALRTAKGIGPGSTVGQLKAAYPATKLEETSLGHEFDAGGLYGIATDPSSSGKVQVIFAGTNCIFR